MIEELNKEMESKPNYEGGETDNDRTSDPVYNPTKSLEI